NIQPLESMFEFSKGWALKSNQKYDHKGSGNHMSIQITNLLEREANKTKGYTAITILEELNNMANEGQFDKFEVPKLQAIRG
ncbi:14803_t:CDS:1, partial [Funneliformis geosporum]